MKEIIVPRNFYARDAVQVARELLGKVIVRVVDGREQRGIIVETEAYRSTDDPACHAFRGKTARNSSLFGPVGHTYIYFIYGNHYCMNIVAKDESTPAGGVLIRAIHLLKDGKPALRIDGPGRFTRSLHITNNENSHDVTKFGPLFVTEGILLDPGAIVCTPRIGISCAKERLWRFYTTL